MILWRVRVCGSISAHGWMDGWMDGRMDGERTNGWTVGGWVGGASDVPTTTVHDAAYSRLHVCGI